jgi:Mn2+/Fe2+ NRAMP family transporter
MKRILAVAALAAAVSTTTVWAETEHTMAEGLSMLEISVKRELNSIGLAEIDPMLLTLNQLAEIQSVMGDQDINEVDKKSRIQAVVGK